eukprot:CAMPEP_0198539652 /NCGR_PEP_ID=MMETSP1462-20131121/49868_1 /TAXON_ID=1333877 /ORGANISM="Brandtodinium nutriculum, Strain RCC3387" /LENGTH=149 /DNA_ID=CAMNT_0044269711 /DNA_START=72 /DNA_END=521 /DNA_ORIENTATION=+
MTTKLTQAELLEKLSEPPFNQSKAVPENAEVTKSNPATWWRSDSPRGDADPDLQAAANPLSVTSGVLGEGNRTGPGTFASSASCGPNTAAHFQNPAGAGTRIISGYSGHIAGKYAGNCIGGTFEKSNEDAVEHLKTTHQVQKYGVGAAM